MANVRVEQRNAYLASPVRLETVNGRDGEVVKGTVTAISNSKRGSGEHREDEPTAIQWTLWGKLADNAARYLGQGSHVNVTGRLRNNHYKDAEGRTVFGFSFTVEEIDYLDSRAESEARKARSPQESGEGDGSGKAAPTKAADTPASSSAKPSARSRKAANGAAADDDIPF